MILNGPSEPPAKTQRLASLMSPAAVEAQLPPRPSSSSSSSHPFRASSLDQPTNPTTPSPTASVSPSRPQPPRLPPPNPMASPIVKPEAFTRPKLPYHPRRITPAGSVLRPLTEAELRTWVSQNPLRNRTRPSPSEEHPLGKRSRTGVDENKVLDEQRPQKRSKDVASVIHHYNARPDVGVDKRQESPIIGLKSFNNWVKSVLISKFAAPALQSSPTPPSRRGAGRGKVLDMGCGKGGDLQKWSKARCAEYVGVDIASQSVDQAYRRWEEMMGRKGNARFEGEFAALDCYVSPLAEAIPPRRLATPFDVVSMQFCMHYAFETESKVRTMLDNVTRYLRVGGMFVGTVPNDQQLMERLAERPDNSPSWGNSVYTIRFDDKAYRLYGQRYSFFLKDAVDDVPEYVVHWDNFQGLAATYGLELRWKKEFHEVFADHQEHPEFKPLLQRMKVVDADGESHMDEDQWEAANVYLAFAFEKVA